MTKTEKKIEKSVIQELTRVCEIAKVDVDGFEWLTHTVDYEDFPRSLKVYCIFGSDMEIKQAIDSGKSELIHDLIRNEFELIDIVFKDISAHVVFDTECGFKRITHSKQGHCH